MLLLPTYIIFYFTFAIDLLMAFSLLLLGLFAFVEASRASAQAYIFADRRTKGFWMVVTGVCAAYGILTLTLAMRGLASNSLLLTLLGFVAAGVFLADVRPAVSTRR